KLGANSIAARLGTDRFYHRRIRRVNYGPSARRSLDEFDQRTHRHAGWALRGIAPRGPGDIKVRPRRLFGKFFEKRGRRDRAGFLPAYVLNVSDVALDLLGVFSIERQLPKLFADFDA